MGSLGLLISHCIDFHNTTKYRYFEGDWGWWWWNVLGVTCSFVGLQSHAHSVILCKDLLSTGCCFPKTHSATQTHVLDHPSCCQPSPTTPADYRGTDTICTMGRTEEWLASQMNCPKDQILNPRTHPVPLSIHFGISKSAGALSTATVKLHCSGAVPTAPAPRMYHHHHPVNSVSTRCTPLPNQINLVILLMDSPSL